MTSAAGRCVRVYLICCRWWCACVQDGINYDHALPEYGTHGGVHHGTAGVVTAPALMWVAALDLLLARLAGDGGVDLGAVAAVSVSGQQHGSVYWAKGAAATLRRLDPARPLAAQLAGAFAVPNSPIWMDSSTAPQCADRERRSGGAAALASVTGSRAYERFTGNQIAKIAALRQPSGGSLLGKVERIALVSSFVATLLTGSHAPIDSSDAGGTNLMDIGTRAWDPDQLRFTTPDLDLDLAALLGGEPVDPRAVVGDVSSFHVARYGFSADCAVVAASGDNPCSLAGLGLSAPGDVGLSLGTSDTLFGVTYASRPVRVYPRAGTGHAVRPSTRTRMPHEACM